MAQAAIGAAHQGVFDLDFRAGLLTLSPEAAQMVGLSVQRDHAECRRLDRRISIPTTATSIRARWRNIATAPAWRSGWNSAPAAQSGPYRWLELRATIVSEQQVPSDCLGLITDITQRKEAEFARRRRKPRASAKRRCRATR